MTSDQTNLGYIIPIGGAEEKLRDAAILRRFVALSGGDAARIAVIPTASRLEDTGDKYVELFRDMGAAEATSLPFTERSDGRREDWLDVLRGCTGVYMTGGNQLRLSTILGGTPVADILRDRNQTEGLVVAGTSAGASIMAEHMIAYGDEGPTPRADMVTLAPGLGLTRRAIIDQHFRQRNRLGRLLTAISYNPRLIGIGLDEDTAAFIDQDRRLEVVGSGALTIVDPTDMEFSSMDSANRHDPVSLINVRIHVLVEGGTFDLRTHEASPGQTVSAP